MFERPIHFIAFFMLMACADGADTSAPSDVTSAPPDIQNICSMSAGYEDGISQEGGAGFLFEIITATPNPPDKGLNTFTIRVDGATALGEEAQLVAEPAMPHHGHGTFPTTFNASKSDDGTFELGPIDLFMSGRWELELRVYTDGDAAGPPSDTTTFTLCLEG